MCRSTKNMCLRVNLPFIRRRMVCFASLIAPGLEVSISTLGMSPPTSIRTMLATGSKGSQSAQRKSLQFRPVLMTFSRALYVLNL